MSDTDALFVSKMSINIETCLNNNWYCVCNLTCIIKILHFYNYFIIRLYIKLIVILCICVCHIIFYLFIFYSYFWLLTRSKRDYLFDRWSNRDKSPESSKCHAIRIYVSFAQNCALLNFYFLTSIKLLIKQGDIQWHRAFPHVSNTQINKLLYF